MGLLTAAGGLLGLLFLGAGVMRLWQNSLKDPGDFIQRVGDSLALAVPAVLLLSLVAIRLEVLNRPLVLLGLAPIVGLGMISTIQAVPRLPQRLPAMAGIGLAAVALFQRRNPVYFLGEWSDFGEYVNRGNAIADGGSPGGYFPPLTETLMAFGHLVFGEAQAIQIIPVIAVLTGLFLAACTFILTRSMAGAAFTGAVFAVHPAAVWFGRLPTSEALYGFLATVFLYQCLRSRQGAPSLPLFVTMMAMITTRPNGLVAIAPFAAAVLLGSLVGDGVRWRRLITPVAGGWLAGYLWLANFGFLRGVFVSVGSLVGAGTDDLAETLSSPGAQVGVVIAATVGALLLRQLSLVVERSAPASLRQYPSSILLAAVCAIGLAILASGQLPILRDGLRSFGIVILILAGAGALIMILGPVATDRGGVALITAQTAMWSFVYSMQFDEAVPHYIYLYWERYLYPTVMLLSFVFAGAVLPFAQSLFTSARTSVGVLSKGIAVVVTIAILLVLVPGDTLQHHEQYHGKDFYEDLAAVAESLPENAIVTYDGVAAEEIWERYFFFYPNTYRVIGSPLVNTFGVQFNNLPVDARAPDPAANLEGATHRLTVRIEPSDAALNETTRFTPISVLPRDSTTSDDWATWTLAITVDAL
ncbi:MAG: hypothetical protein HKN03_13705 [Acidimicrobiales bacterium]|nr:hypothetical protein [Acidimicrobiales bacterium]